MLLARDPGWAESYKGVSFLLSIVDLVATSFHLHLFSFHRADKDGSDQLNIIFRLLTNSSSSSDKLCREPCELIYSSHC